MKRLHWRETNFKMTAKKEKKTRRRTLAMDINIVPSLISMSSPVKVLTCLLSLAVVSSSFSPVLLGQTRSPIGFGPHRSTTGTLDINNMNRVSIKSGRNNLFARQHIPNRNPSSMSSNGSSSSRLFYSIETGPNGKPASSKEEDLELTIRIILEHIRQLDGERDIDGQSLDESALGEEGREEDRIEDGEDQTESDESSEIDETFELANESTDSIESNAIAQETVEETVEEKVEEKVEETAQNIEQDIEEDIAQETIEETVEEIAQETVEEIAQEIVEEIAQETVEETAQDSLEDVTEYNAPEIEHANIEEEVGEPSQLSNSEQELIIVDDSNVDEVIEKVEEQPQEEIVAQKITEEQEDMVVVEDTNINEIIEEVNEVVVEEVEEPVEEQPQSSNNQQVVADEVSIIEEAAEEIDEETTDDAEEASQSSYNEQEKRVEEAGSEEVVEEVEELLHSSSNQQQAIVVNDADVEDLLEEVEEVVGEVVEEVVEEVKEQQSQSSNQISNEVAGLTTSSNENDILSKLTSCFPLFVLSAAITGVKQPQLLTWVNHGPIIPIMLGAVMTFMGMTLSTQDFKDILSPSNSQSDNESNSLLFSPPTSSSSSIAAIPIGVLCQYLIMPLTAFAIGSKTLLPSHTAAFLGLILVGCSPGGTASNLVSLIAKADVALSVILTSASTLLASILTPLLVKVLVGSTIAVSGKMLCKATAQVILGPIILGMTIRKVLPKLADLSSKFAPFAGVLLVSLLCGGVVAQNAAIFLSGGADSTIFQKTIFSVLGLHTIGFGFGYLMPRKVFGLSERTSRTISIETGMQNSALAVVLAKSVVSAMDAPTTAIMSLAMLPGAMSATAHSCLGSALAVYWRFIDAANKKRKMSRI